jgi:murein DD-endopeptidase MepM/ murein hydrolase activator NlpD
MKWQHPFPESTISSRFGVTIRRTSPHRGTDYAPGGGSLIPAVTAGTVEAIQWSQCLGWVMTQKCSCPEHSGSGGHRIGYCHLSCATHGDDCKGPRIEGCTTPFKNLKTGDSISMGQPVGRVGNTGDCSRGAHLHLTIGTGKKSPFRGQVYDIAKFINQKLTAKREVCKCCKRPI